MLAVFYIVVIFILFLAVFKAGLLGFMHGYKKYIDKKYKDKYNTEVYRSLRKR